MKCTDRKRDCGVVTSPKLKILGKGNYGEISKIKYHNEYYAAKSSDFMDGLMDVSVGVLLKHPNVLDIENVRTHYDCEKINGLFFTSGVYIPANKILGTIEPNKAILDVVTGLRALEKIDCYHFDLKLPNLLYNSETGNILVADLGGCHFMIRKKERVGIWVSSTQHHAPLSIYSSLRNFKITYSHSVFALGILAAEFVLAEEFDILHLGHDRTIYNETLSESKNTREQIKFLERGLKKSTGLCSELISQSIECLKDRYYLYKVKPLLSYLDQDATPIIYFPDLSCSVEQSRFMELCMLVSGLNLNISISMILCTGVAVLVSKNVSDSVFYGYLYLALTVLDLLDIKPDPEFELSEAVSILGGMLVPISVADLCSTREEMYTRVIEFINSPSNFTGDIIGMEFDEPFSVIIEPKRNKYIGSLARKIKQ